MTTYKELQEQIAKLQQEAERLLKAERSQAIANIIDQMALLGISVEDLRSKSAGRKPTKPSGSPMYKDPSTGKTWSGRGRQPAWLKGSRDNYLIK